MSLIALLCLASPAHAQFWRSGASVPAFDPGITMRGTDAAYDPVNDVYLVVVGHGPIFGVFVNGAGVPVAPAFVIMDGSLGWGSFPRVEFGAQMPNGTGGFGAFLVTWHHNVGPVNYVFARVVSYWLPSRFVTDIKLISDGTQGGSFQETGPSVAYSKTSARFLVVWRTYQYGIQGRFVSTMGDAIGPVMPLENPGASRDPSIAWNPGTDEFGLVYTGWDGGAHASFRRIRASDGALSPRAVFGFAGGTYATAIDVNTANNNYVVAWSLHPGTVSAVFDPSGNLLASTLVSLRIGFDQSLGMSYNPLSGTLLAVSSDSATFEIAGVELTTSAMPIGLAQILTDGARSGSFYPMTSVRPGAGQWDIVYARDFRAATNQVMGTSTRGGGTSLLPPGPGPSPSPSPTPQPAGCTTPDPFVAIGGGICVNGGWVPRGTSVPAPAPAPPPAPAPSSCTTPDPFASLGGGTCVNGGWIPRGSSAAPAPAPAPAPPSGCTTPDPFTSIGGGSCVNGGWIPAVSSCRTPNPFASLGVGRCVNGGWVPW